MKRSALALILLASFCLIAYQNFTSTNFYHILRVADSGLLPNCYKAIFEFNSAQYPVLVEKHCDGSTENEYFSLITNGWDQRSKDKDWSIWLIRNQSSQLIEEVDLRQSAAYTWNDDKTAARLEDNNTEQCALREVTLGFDYPDAGLRRLTNGSEASLADFKTFYFGAYMRTSANNVMSYCKTNPHHFASLDFIYEYESDGKVLVSNAIHMVFSKMNHKDSVPDRADLLYKNGCIVHPIYKNKTCSVILDGAYWGINVLGNEGSTNLVNVNAEFLKIISRYEGEGLLSKPLGLDWKSAKIRHLQIVSSVRGGARYLRIKSPFAFGDLK